MHVLKSTSFVTEQESVRRTMSRNELPLEKRSEGGFDSSL